MAAGVTASTASATSAVGAAAAATAATTVGRRVGEASSAALGGDISLAAASALIAAESRFHVVARALVEHFSVSVLRRIRLLARVITHVIHVLVLDGVLLARSRGSSSARAGSLIAIPAHGLILAVKIRLQVQVVTERIKSVLRFLRRRR